MQLLFLGNLVELEFTNGVETKVVGSKLLFPKALEFRLEKEIKMWFMSVSREKITQRLEYQANIMNAKFSTVMFSDTKSKWGTCFADNSLQFNWRLIMAPIMVIDYVIIHELTHTIEKNHSNSFWRKVARFTPAFRQHRKWLTENGNLLMTNL